MAARMVSGVRQSEHITTILEDLHWLPVSQRVVIQTALMVWKCVHGVTQAHLSDLCVPATAISGRQHLRSAATSTTDSMLQDCNWIMKFCSQRTSHMEPSSTSTSVTRPVGEHLQADTEDAPVFDRPTPLRRLHYFGSGYKYPDLLTYLLSHSVTLISFFSFTASSLLIYGDNNSENRQFTRCCNTLNRA